MPQTQFAKIKIITNVLSAWKHRIICLTNTLTTTIFYVCTWKQEHDFFRFRTIFRFFFFYFFDSNPLYENFTKIQGNKLSTHTTNLRMNALITIKWIRFKMLLLNDLFLFSFSFCLYSFSYTLCLALFDAFISLSTRSYRYSCIKVQCKCNMPEIYKEQLEVAAEAAVEQVRVYS